VRAALETLDEAGLDGLTMRRLADRLGVQSPSLYWHVHDKDELLSLIADAICGEIEPPDPSLPWVAQLEAVAWEYRRVLSRRRDSALVLANTPPVGPNRLRLAERMLAVLVDAGFTPAVAALAGRLLTDHATNALIEEGRDRAMAGAGRDNRRGDPDGGGGDGDGDGRSTDWTDQLAGGDYPTLAALASDLTKVDAETRYRFGVQVIIAGLVAQRESRVSGLD
jgi:TetR/AcrR family tetracycline transcriptional repressor